MKIKKIFMSCLLLAGVLSASAQEQYPKTVYDHNPYWYIQLQGGAQYTLGEIDFKDLISPNVQVAIGRQFSPVFGIRLQANAWQSKAGWNGYTFVTKNADGSITEGSRVDTKWKWNWQSRRWHSARPSAKNPMWTPSTKNSPADTASTVTSRCALSPQGIRMQVTSSKKRSSADPFRRTTSRPLKKALPNP